MGIATTQRVTSSFDEGEHKQLEKHFNEINDGLRFVLREQKGQGQKCLAILTHLGPHLQGHPSTCEQGAPLQEQGWEAFQLLKRIIIDLRIDAGQRSLSRPRSPPRRPQGEPGRLRGVCVCGSRHRPASRTRFQ